MRDRRLAAIVGIMLAGSIVSAVPAQASVAWAPTRPVPVGTTVWTYLDSYGYDSPMSTYPYIRRAGKNVRIANIIVMIDPASRQVTDVRVSCATGTVAAGKSIVFVPGSFGADYLTVKGGVLTDSNPNQNVWTKYKPTTLKLIAARIVQGGAAATAAGLEQATRTCM